MPSEKCCKASPRMVTLLRNVNRFCRTVSMINSPFCSIDRQINRYQAWSRIQRVLRMVQVGWYPGDNRLEASCSPPPQPQNWHWRSRFVSSGMVPLIRAVLSNLLEEQANEIEIIANDVAIESNGNWEIKYRHPTRWLSAQWSSHINNIIRANRALYT